MIVTVQTQEPAASRTRKAEIETKPFPLSQVIPSPDNPDPTNILNYTELIRHIAYNLSHGDDWLADDLQQVMYKRLLGLDGLIMFNALKYARFAAIDYLKSRKHTFSYGNTKPHVSLESTRLAGFQYDSYGQYLPPESSQYDCTYRPDQISDTILLKPRLQQIKKYFTKREWLLLDLHYRCGYTPVEIAAMPEIQVGSSMISKIIKRCKGRLEGLS